MKPLRYQTRDYAAYGVLMAYLVSIGDFACADSDFDENGGEECAELS